MKFVLFYTKAKENNDVTTSTISTVGGTIMKENLHNLPIDIQLNRFFQNNKEYDFFDIKPLSLTKKEKSLYDEKFLLVCVNKQEYLVNSIVNDNI